MLQELQKTYEKAPAVELYDLIDALHSWKQVEGKHVRDHVLEMKNYMDQLCSALICLSWECKCKSNQ